MRRNSQGLRIPEPDRRPGELPDFSHIEIPAAGEADRPAIDIDPIDIRHPAYALIRVLDKRSGHGPLPVTRFSRRVACGP
jgi:2-oxoisovalerate dehydrogenase E1 alpha subunit N terminal